MGEIEINSDKKEVIIHSQIHLYGNASSVELTKRFSDEIADLWNEAEGTVKIENEIFTIRFAIKGFYRPDITKLEIEVNQNPRNNYFRVEDYSPINISWVDGIKSNTGYMFIDNLYEGSTTAAHEYGHTLGLEHPVNLNLIGRGSPGIMFPRGTLVDPIYQYNPMAMPGQPGGTMHPMHRKVWPSEVDLLSLDEIITSGSKIIGAFSSIYHGRHLNPANTA